MPALKKTVVTTPSGAKVETHTAPAAPAAPAAPVLTFDYATSGASIARADAQRARLLGELGEHLTAECAADLAKWNAARDAFIKGAQSVGYVAPEKLWERTIKAGQELGLVPDKPKAATAEATRKAAARAEKASKVDTLATQHAPAELVKMAGEAIKAGDAGKAADLLKASKAAQAAADKAAREKAGAALDAHCKAIREAVRRLEKAGDVAKLAQLAKLAQKLSPEPAAAPV